jgi:L-serine dehydratase
MRAANLFIQRLGASLAAVSHLEATVFGSLAWTGKGHGTDKALVLGFGGHEPATVDPDKAGAIYAAVSASHRLPLPGGVTIPFDPCRDIRFDQVATFARHSNAMRFAAFDAAGQTLATEVWYSVGGGFVERDGDTPSASARTRPVPYPYDCASELLRLGRQNGLAIAAMVLANEAALSTEAEALASVDLVAGTMFACIERGLGQSGELPGGLNVKRRSGEIYAKLEAHAQWARAPHETMDYVSAFAMAVNEENAAGGRVVTAPTNGAAGVVPAVLRYYRDFCPGAGPAGVRVILLVATAIGDIIKRNASISGAEVGCQGEVGSAAAMAAGGLAAALGGTNEQVENAAEIAMEHHLGMTCDPVGGLVQIPCIERNAFGALKAINAASLALRGDGSHNVTLDEVVETMRQTGRDMQAKYRETSRGGLAINVPEC